MDQKCEMEKLEEQADNPIEQMMYATIQMRDTLRNMNPTLLYDLKKYYPAHGSFFRTYKHEYIIKSIRDNLIKGIELGFTA
jgi:hypothetical protein